MKETKFEKARLIGARALQISKGAPLLIKLTEKQLKEINFKPVEIAKMEFKKGKLLMDVKRPMPSKRVIKS